PSDKPDSSEVVNSPLASSDNSNSLSLSTGELSPSRSDPDAASLVALGSRLNSNSLLESSSSPVPGSRVSSNSLLECSSPTGLSSMVSSNSPLESGLPAIGRGVGWPGLGVADADGESASGLSPNSISSLPPSSNEMPL